MILKKIEKCLSVVPQRNTEMLSCTGIIFLYAIPQFPYVKNFSPLELIP